MNEFAKRNFNLILFLSTVAGFVLPEPGEIAGILILAVLSFIIFASSFKVDFSIAFFKAQFPVIISFYLLRFFVLPVVLFYLILPFSAFYASSVFLLCVLPAGVTAPAFTNVFGGSITLALSLLILSSSFIPLVLPFLSEMMMSEVLKVDQFRLFLTLFVTVIFPYLAHLPLRKKPGINHWMQNHDSFISIVGIAVIFTVAIAEYRQVLFSQTEQVLPYFLVSLTVFFFLYVFGWAVLFKSKQSSRMALLFTSGANNVALGVVISFLYFPVEMGVFFVVSEIVWVVVLIPVRQALKHLLPALKS